jgi:prophage antirepressor-like protein
MLGVDNIEQLLKTEEISSFEDMCIDAKIEMVQPKLKEKMVEPKLKEKFQALTQLKRGWQKELARQAGCTPLTVHKALYYSSSGEKANRVRKLYEEKYGHIQIKTKSIESEQFSDTRGEIVKVEEISQESLGQRLFTFAPGNQTIRVEIINNEPWFVAKDVCDVLKLTNVSESLKGIDDDEKLTSAILRAGQKREMNFVNESGLYVLIFQSHKPDAKIFRKWVTSEVLPSLRKTGEYHVKRRRSHCKPVPANSDIASLLQLIAENLQKNDKTTVAEQLGVRQGSVSNILSGKTKSSAILHALYEKALENKRNGFVNAYANEFVTNAIANLEKNQF